MRCMRPENFGRRTWVASEGSIKQGGRLMMMTGEQYEESLRKLNLVVYMFGERVENPVDNPIIRPSMNAVKKTYELAHQPEHEDLMSAISHLTGRKSTAS